MSSLVYFDSSAMAKVFWKEAGTERVLHILSEAEAAASVSLAYVELISATFRASRRGDVPSSDVAGVLEAIRRSWDDIIEIPVDDSLIREASELVRRHPLRAYDALHLAAALRWQALMGEPVLFVAFDKDLLDAARDEGLPTAQ